jgi:hypothetical protein
MSGLPDYPADRAIAKMQEHLGFAPSSANPCDNLHPKLRLLPGAE